MTKLILASVAAVLGLASVASADRGNYSRDRAQASVRYERGGGDRGRGYDRGRDLDRGRDYDRGRGYGRDYGRSRSSLNLSLGFSSGGYGDRSFFGLDYSRGGYSRGYQRYVAPRYYRSTRVYVAPPPVLYAPPAVLYPAPSYYVEPSYGYGGGYYCR